MDTPTKFVQLALMIDWHFPGYVDAYFGPAEIKAQVDAGDKPPLEALEELAASLVESISTDPDLSPDRRGYLQEELQAMCTTLRILAGDAPDFVDEVRLLYGVTPAWIDERLFQEAHKTLAGILPGSEPLPERIRRFRERSRVPVDQAVAIIRRLVAEFRGRTLQRFGLPPGESCEIETVSDRPWIAFNWFLGNGKSRIEFNLDYPMEVWGLPTSVAHEAYPGHHTEFSIKERELYLGKGRLEHSILLSNNPSSLISEGIASNALLAIASDDEIAALLADIYTQAGLPEEDARVAWTFAKANRQLQRVSDNQLLLLYRDHAPDSEVIDYGIRYALDSKDEEQRYLRFYKDPLSRSYAYNYTLGSELIASFLNRSPDKRLAFHQLLSQPITPPRLRTLTTT